MLKNSKTFNLLGLRAYDKSFWKCFLQNDEREKEKRFVNEYRKIEGVSASRNIFLKENGSPVIDFVSSPFHSAPWRNLKLQPLLPRLHP